MLKVFQRVVENRGTRISSSHIIHHQSLTIYRAFIPSPGEPGKSEFYRSSSCSFSHFTGSCKLEIRECTGELKDEVPYYFAVEVDAGLREEALQAIQDKYNTDWFMGTEDYQPCKEDEMVSS